MSEPCNRATVAQKLERKQPNINDADIGSWWYDSDGDLLVKTTNDHFFAVTNGHVWSATTISNVNQVRPAKVTITWEYCNE